jgi:lipase
MTVLHVHELGDKDGAAIVALHGIRGHGGRWRFLARDHLAGRRVLGLDLRGHGRSPWEPPWTLERHAEDVLTTMDALGVGRADLVGHSFGGAVAVYVSHLAPGRVRRLVLLDPGIGLPPANALLGARISLLDVAFDEPALARGARAARWPGGATEEMLDDEVEHHLVRGDDGRWRWRFEPAAVVAAFSEMARPAITPAAGIHTLLVPVTESPAVPPEVVTMYESVLSPVLEVATLDGDHNVYIGNLAATGELVANFLR